jgi:3-oxoacyl-[acyl-carrier protein] reductase
LEDRVAIITGGAQGIGRSIVQRFAAEGARVIIADIQVEKALELNAEITACGGISQVIEIDLRKESDIERMISFAGDRFGRLDVLVNTACPFRPQPQGFEDDLKLWDDQQNVLLKASALAARYACDLMKNSHGGAIINMGSMVSRHITHQPCIYHVAKAGVEHLTRYLAFEFGPFGIRVNCILPGIINREREGTPISADPINKSVLELVVPLRRAGAPDEVANLALFLASDESSYITGQNIEVDGGLSLGEPFHVSRLSYTAARQSVPV